MIKLQKHFVSKALAVVLSFLLFSGNFAANAAARQDYPNREEDNSDPLQFIFNDALKKYQERWYSLAAAKLEAILSVKGEVKPGLKAKVYLTLGACYEQLDQKETARDYFLELKGMLESGVIAGVPQVPGIDTGSLAEYAAAFREDAAEPGTPAVESGVSQEKVVHAPRKSKRRKVRKKFPWRFVIGSLIAAGVVAVIIISNNKKMVDATHPTITWVKIGAGEFPMGDNFNEGDPDEQPVHKVYLDEFEISRYEITRFDYWYYCQATGKTFPYKGESNWNIALTDISWDEAQSFCQWLSQMTGEDIQLPTEAQWEKAARRDTQNRYPWGNKLPKKATSVNYNRAENGSVTTAGVYFGDRSPNGLCDLGGNAAEWCRDWYSASYYSVSPHRNPTGPANGTFRVVRGGSYKSDADGIRAANRHFAEPGKSYEHIGFRVVKEK